MKTVIHLEKVSVRFRIYQNPSPSLKDSILNILSRQRHLNSYHEFHALKNISLNLEPGDRVGFIGRNGAGKSTLLKTISGIYRPHEGEILVQGRLTPLMELGAGFDSEQTGRRNIYLNGAMLGFSPQEMREKEIEIEQFSELGDFLDLPVKYYSSGMYGRLAFSIAVCSEPEILIIDEVFATGDGHFVEKSTKKVEAMIETTSILLVVSHNLEQVRRLCNRVIWLQDGVIVGDGEPGSVISKYQQSLS